MSPSHHGHRHCRDAKKRQELKSLQVVTACGWGHFFRSSGSDRTYTAAWGDEAKSSAKRKAQHLQYKPGLSEAPWFNERITVRKVIAGHNSQLDDWMTGKFQKTSKNCPIESSPKRSSICSMRSSLVNGAEPRLDGTHPCDPCDPCASELSLQQNPRERERLVVSTRRQNVLHHASQNWEVTDRLFTIDLFLWGPQNSTCERSPLQGSIQKCCTVSGLFQFGRPHCLPKFLLKPLKNMTSWTAFVSFVFACPTPELIVYSFRCVRFMCPSQHSLRQGHSSFVVRCVLRIANCANFDFGSPGGSMNCPSRIPTYWCAFLNCKGFSKVRVTSQFCFLFLFFGRSRRWIHTPQKSTWRRTL